MSRFTLTLFTALFVVAAPRGSAEAQDRTTSGRARLELSFDHGYGFGTEGQHLEVAADLRVWSPHGIGVALRTGAALQGLSNALAIELGLAGRIDVLSNAHVGVQLVGAMGPSLASGPFDGGDVLAYGGWALLNLDLWYRNFFIGVGLSGHALLSERHAAEADPSGLGERRGGAPILSLTPLIRVGGEWGL